MSNHLEYNAAKNVLLAPHNDYIIVAVKALMDSKMRVGAAKLLRSLINCTLDAAVKISDEIFENKIVVNNKFEIHFEKYVPPANLSVIDTVRELRAVTGVPLKVAMNIVKGTHTDTLLGTAFGSVSCNQVQKKLEHVGIFTYVNKV